MFRVEPEKSNNGGSISITGFAGSGDITLQSGFGSVGQLGGAVNIAGGDDSGIVPVSGGIAVSETVGGSVVVPGGALHLHG